MFAEEHSRYVLLSQENRTLWNLDKNTVIFISVLSLPVIIFCGTYMTLFGIYEKIIYPSASTLREVPNHWFHRAFLYSTFPNELNAPQEYHLNMQSSIEIEEYKLVCYYNFPKEANALQVEELDPFLCTHINAAFVQIVNNSIHLDDLERFTLKKLVNLKRSNSNLKILISVGGADSNNGFPEMVLNHTNRKSFIKSVLYFINNYHIDGVDLDWEFPNEEPNTDKNQRMHFTQLLEELRNTIEKQQQRFLVSVAVAAPTYLVNIFYDVSYLNEYVDYVNLMSYDYHFYTKLTPFTGINSPLYASDSEKLYFASLNINCSSYYWNYLGMERNKIIIGLPTYGHTFTLINIKNNGLYAPSSGYGKLGIRGFADYSQICSFLITNQISPIFDMDSRSPYATKFSEWISFDDPQSLTYKAEYIRDKKFGGAMVYSLNSDDYRGTCKAHLKKETFPLTRSIKQVLKQK